MCSGGDDAESDRWVGDRPLFEGQQISKGKRRETDWLSDACECEDT